MNRENIFLVAFFTMIFTIITTGVMAQANSAPAGLSREKGNPPFLITGKLPHLTKLLITQWDNPQLNLTETQKSKLLVVRKETIGGVKRLGQEIAPLEQQVADGIFAGKTPDELQTVVQKVADLKSEATMVHLRCIYDTSTILDKQQLDFLKSTGNK